MGNLVSLWRKNVNNNNNNNNNTLLNNNNNNNDTSKKNKRSFESFQPLDDTTLPNAKRSTSTPQKTNNNNNNNNNINKKSNDARDSTSWFSFLTNNRDRTISDPTRRTVRYDQPFHHKQKQFSNSHHH